MTAAQLTRVRVCDGGAVHPPRPAESNAGRMLTARRALAAAAVVALGLLLLAAATCGPASPFAIAIVLVDVLGCVTYAAHRRVLG